MVCDITKDTNILTQISEKIVDEQTTPSVWTDLKQLITDLTDTAEYHKHICAGLSAIQINVPKRVCVIKHNGIWQEIINPVILKTNGKPKIYEEACLSVDGIHQVKRYTHIFIKYERFGKEPYIGWISGFFAEVFQHELDHMNGKLI